MLLLFISTILVLSSAVKGYDDYEDITDTDEETDEDYGESYQDGDETSTTSSFDDSTVNRVKRNELQSTIKKLRSEDVRDVRGVLKHLLSGIAVENPFTPFTTATYTQYPTLSSTISLTPTYDTSVTPNTIYSTTSTYLSNLLTEIFEFSNPEPTRSKHHLKYKMVGLDNLLARQRGKPQPVATTKQPPNNQTNQTLVTRKVPQLDIPRLLAIISKLASEFETNLTRKLNETIKSMSFPTCTTPTLEPPITSEYDANYTGSIVSKCFVCGLTTPQIPHHSHCADAFAGDFLPLVPVDPTARGKISRFRKYCKYSNVNGYYFNESEPRVIIGRWTGGCSVRWIDLSGVYTQRSCRNRIQPAMGKHFASKRMAKLERALWNLENGCITSPMATLVPLSRGVSLYARFHACVCTGSWCNTSGLSVIRVTLLLTVLSILFAT